MIKESKVCHFCGKLSGDIRQNPMSIIFSGCGKFSTIFGAHPFEGIACGALKTLGADNIRPYGSVQFSPGRKAYAASPVDPPLRARRAL